jgi:glycosyltransferase involved in cell wall biosynthesis
MRVVVVHNRYRSALPSGENSVVDAEVQALRTAGIDVVTYLRSSDEIAQMSAASRLGLAGSAIYGRGAVNDLRALLAEQHVDLVHLHNVYPLISPAVIRTVRAHHVPVVHTVHNQRLVCVEGTCTRSGTTCEDCVGRSVPWPAIVHGCYRGSRLQTVPMAVAQTVHRRTWAGVDRYLAPSTFVRERLERAGTPANRIVVKPNLTDDPGRPTSSRSPRIVFAGRLEVSKGIDRLLDAWTSVDLGAAWRLVIAGDGPLRDLVERAVATDDRIEFVGAVSRERVGALLDGAACAVVPSRVAEAGSLSVLEAFARGVPVIASTSGALPELVGDGGALFATEDDLGRLLARLPSEDLRARSLVARREYDERFAPEILMSTLLGVYDDVVETARA